MSEGLNLGERIKAFRLDREWTQQQSSVFFRVSLETIKRIEAGRNCADLTRAKIEKALSQQEQAAYPCKSYLLLTHPPTFSG